MKLITGNKSIGIFFALLTCYIETCPFVCLQFPLDHGLHIYDRANELNRIFAELESLHLDPPVVGHRYPFERLPEALQSMQSSKSVCKIVREV